jgi:hypothetical protein
VIRPVVLRNGVEIEDSLELTLGFLEAYPAYDAGVASAPGSFREADLRLANRGGARISAAEIAAILARRRAIERALGAIAPDASLAGAAVAIPWLPLSKLFAAFADIRGVGFAKMTKALHRKRPALIPLLDSVVQRHLGSDDPGRTAPFAERALALVQGYKRDVDRNGAALRDVSRELAKRGHAVTEVRILDVLIWSAETVMQSSPAALPSERRRR